jgi:hypothetical protein
MVFEIIAFLFDVFAEMLCEAVCRGFIHMVKAVHGVFQ